MVTARAAAAHPPMAATPPMADLREMLSGGRVHVMDGAMGTMLYARGVFFNVCYDELNATHPDLVEDVHEQYIRAGADIIETNTFGANPVKLSSHGLDARTEELNERAAAIAVRAASGRAAVAGAVGPLGIRLEPLGPTSLEEARDYFGRQVDGLLAGGVDGFILETFSDLVELEQAFRAVRSRCDLPVIAQVTVGEDGVTAYERQAIQNLRHIAGAGVDAMVTAPYLEALSPAGAAATIALAYLALWAPEGLALVVEHPTVADGITEDETVVVSTLWGCTGPTLTSSRRSSTRPA